MWRAKLGKDEILRRESELERFQKKRSDKVRWSGGQREKPSRKNLLKMCFLFCYSSLTVRSKCSMCFTPSAVFLF